MFDILNSNFISGVVSALVSAGIALLGVIISLAWSTSNAKKGMEQALKIYESELTRKVYASSKRLDMEYDIFRELSSCCSDIFQLMQLLYPDKLSTIQVRSERKPVLNELAVAIGRFEKELAFSAAFIPDDIILRYRALLEKAEEFFADASKHDSCWDDTKYDRAKKSGLRDVAYEAKKSFKTSWESVGGEVKKHLQEKEQTI